jgi:hypothetical protein
MRTAARDSTATKRKNPSQTTAPGPAPFERSHAVASSRDVQRTTGAGGAQGQLRCDPEEAGVAASTDAPSTGHDVSSIRFFPERSERNDSRLLPVLATAVRVDEEEASLLRTALQTSGGELPAHLREQFESRFGRDFGEGRIHTDEKAQRTALLLQTRAFTVGRRSASRSRRRRHRGPGGDATFVRPQFDRDQISPEAASIRSTWAPIASRWSWPSRSGCSPMRSESPCKSRLSLRALRNPPLAKRSMLLAISPTAHLASHRAVGDRRIPTSSWRFEERAPAIAPSGDSSRTVRSPTADTLSPTAPPWRRNRAGSYRATTVMVPTMPISRCTTQTYSYLPGSSNVSAHACPSGLNSPMIPELKYSSSS